MACVLLSGGGLAAEPVRVRFPEGTSHGFLVLGLTTGEPVAHGEFIQVFKAGRMESRLTFRFKDGSLFDETVVFSQQRVFSLHTYRLVQRGPAFGGSSADVSFDRTGGHYRARIKEKADKAEEAFEGPIELPADVHNGMTGMLLKNLPAGTSGTGHLLAFTPKPRLVKTELVPVGEDRFLIGGAPWSATRYHVKLELGGVIGVIATILGKEPPDLYYWITRSPAPSFVKFEGPFSVNGPRWRVEMTAARWPSNAVPVAPASSMREAPGGRRTKP